VEEGNMTDGESIVQLMNLYALAVDAKQLDLWDRVFVPDVEADYPWGRWDNLQSWREDFLVAMVEPFDVTQHLVLNLNWNLSGDAGYAVSQGLFRLIRRGFPGGEAVAGGAWFDDELRMTADGWRISRRVCRVTWMEGNLAVMSKRRPDPPTSMSEGVKDGSLRFIGTL
jgi:hypothetical protein